MNYTITTKSELKDLLAKKHSPLNQAIDSIFWKDEKNGESRIILVPSEEWKEECVGTRCTVLSSCDLSGEMSTIHIVYASTCHIKKIRMKDSAVKPSENIILDIFPITSRKEGIPNTFYVVFEISNTTGKKNDAFGRNEVAEIILSHGEEAQEIVDAARKVLFEQLSNTAQQGK